MKILVRDCFRVVGVLALAVGVSAMLGACGRQAKGPGVAASPLPGAAQVAAAIAALAPEPPLVVEMPPPSEAPAVPSPLLPPPAAPATAVQDAAPAPPPANLLTAEQLDKLVAPIALYPDPLLAQLLPGSTYPLEVVQASRWAQANKGLSGSELESAVANRDWAQSVKALCAFPDVLKYMDEHLDWTTQLGDAVLGQEQDVLDAIQRMRARAQAAGTLKSNDKQTVEVQTQGERTVVVVEPADPEVIYVPAYDPEVIYYPSPTYVYDPGYISFGFGISVGSFFWNYYDCDWYDRRLVYYDYDHGDWWRHGHRRYRHCRIDWDDHDWDRYDWRRGDRIRHRGFDIDIRHINIDNIDINHCDWRNSDFRRFDWNRVDWRRVRLDRLDLQKGDWDRMDWAKAGITDRHLIEKLKKASPQDREWLRGRFERSSRNQKYKDLMVKAQTERRPELAGGTAGQQADKPIQWKHEPKHRRGVEYRGPAKTFQAGLDRSKAGPDVAGSVVSEKGNPLRGRDGLKSKDLKGNLGDNRSGDLSREGGKSDKMGKNDKMRMSSPDGVVSSAVGDKGRDEDKSNRILEGLRGRAGRSGHGDAKDGAGRLSEKGKDQLKEPSGADKLSDKLGKGQNRGVDDEISNRTKQPSGLDKGLDKLGKGQGRGGDNEIGSRIKQPSGPDKASDKIGKVQDHGRDEEISNRIMERFREKQSSEGSRQGGLGKIDGNDGGGKSNAAKRSYERSYEIPKRTQPQIEFSRPDRSIKERDSGSYGEMFRRESERSRSRDYKAPSFDRGIGDFGRSYERKSDGGGSRYDGGSRGGSSRGGSEFKFDGGGHRSSGSFKSGGGSSFKSDGGSRRSSGSFKSGGGSSFKSDGGGHRSSGSFKSGGGSNRSSGGERHGDKKNKRD